MNNFSDRIYYVPNRFAQKQNETYVSFNITIFPDAYLKEMKLHIPLQNIPFGTIVVKQLSQGWSETDVIHQHHFPQPAQLLQQVEASAYPQEFILPITHLYQDWKRNKGEENHGIYILYPEQIHAAAMPYLVFYTSNT
ncbi:hypothetical protein [Longirhabdus pacifica]|uniref:hypothetical protein n=1 Tax=Longirhabdus pacifica TaxID=2305227 RepID=UPI001008BA87|nr:hypothetical protein [Longirhabdus pacifica]